jgi:hypothetical protein
MSRTRALIREPALCVLTAEPGLSLAAKGLAAFLLSRPVRPVTRAELFSSNSDGMPFIESAIRELERVGMVERVAGRGRGRPRDLSGIQLRVPTASAS